MPHRTPGAPRALWPLLPLALALAALVIQSPLPGLAVPTVTVIYFSAQLEGARALLSWETSSEVDNGGFDLYRGMAPGGPYPDRVNDPTIPFWGSQGVYSYYDDLGFAPGATYYYALMAVPLDSAGEPAIVATTELSVPNSPTPTATASSNASVTPATTSSPGPSATATRTGTPTRTRTPSRTPTFTRTPTPTRTPSATRTPSNTPPPTATTATDKSATPEPASNAALYPLRSSAVPTALAYSALTPPSSVVTLPAATATPVEPLPSVPARRPRPTGAPIAALATALSGGSPIAPSPAASAATATAPAGGANQTLDRLLQISALLGAAALLLLAVALRRPGRP